MTAAEASPRNGLLRAGELPVFEQAAARTEIPGATATMGAGERFVQIGFLQYSP